MTFMDFGSLDEAFDFMTRQTEIANASLTPEQRSLTWGSCWFRPYEGIVIFGHVYTAEEFEQKERHSYHRGGPLDAEEEAEFAYAKERVLDAHERGYLFGEAFSVWEPTGELGDTHRASAWPITERQFESARTAGWDHTDRLIKGWLKPLLETIQARF